MCDYLDMQFMLEVVSLTSVIANVFVYHSGSGYITFTSGLPILLKDIWCGFIWYHYTANYVTAFIVS